MNECGNSLYIPFPAEDSTGILLEEGDNLFVLHSFMYIIAYFFKRKIVIMHKELYQYFQFDISTHQGIHFWTQKIIPLMF